jgi:hypothetical protein
MTRATGGTELTVVLVVPAVAGVAVGGCTLELLVAVAFFALHFSVSIGERKSSLAVIDLQHLATAIMTGKTTVAKPLLVIGHERTVQFAVTLGATALVKRQVFRAMAVETLKRPHPKPFVFFQREGSLLVGKTRGVQDLNGPVPPSMVGMAGLARSDGLEPAVETLFGGQGIPHIDMANQTPIRRAVGTPGQGMTVLTGTFEIGVRGSPTQGLTIGVTSTQGPRSQEQRTSLRPGGSH